MQASDTLMVTLYATTVGAILTIGLLFLVRASIRDRGKRGKYFRLILIFNLLLCLSEAGCYCARNHMFGRFDVTVAQISGTLVEIFIMMIIWNWLIYTDFQLYHSMDHIRFRYRYLAIPLYICLALLCVNFFKGIVFAYDANVVSHHTVIYDIQTVIKYLYVVGTFVLIYIHKRRFGTLHFVSIWSFAVPLIVVSVLTIITPYSLMGLGIAVACVMIYFSVLNQRVYQDAETGLYNKVYFEHLMNLYKKGEYTFESGIIMDCDGEGAESAKDLAGILKSEMPEECEAIRINKNRYLSLTRADRSSSLKRLAEELSWATEEWNEEHNGNLEVNISWLLKKEGEDAAAFVDRLMDQV